MDGRSEAEKLYEEMRRTFTGKYGEYGLIVAPIVAGLGATIALIKFLIAYKNQRKVETKENNILLAKAGHAVLSQPDYQIDLLKKGFNLEEKVDIEQLLQDKDVNNMLEAVGIGNGKDKSFLIKNNNDLLNAMKEIDLGSKDIKELFSSSDSDKFDSIEPGLSDVIKSLSKDYGIEVIATKITGNEKMGIKDQYNLFIKAPAGLKDFNLNEVLKKRVIENLNTIALYTFKKRQHDLFKKTEQYITEDEKSRIINEFYKSEPSLLLLDKLSESSGARLLINPNGSKTDQTKYAKEILNKVEKEGFWRQEEAYDSNGQISIADVKKEITSNPESVRFAFDVIQNPATLQGPYPAIVKQKNLEGEPLFKIKYKIIDKDNPDKDGDWKTLSYIPAGTFGELINNRLLTFEGLESYIGKGNISEGLGEQINELHFEEKVGKDNTKSTSKETGTDKGVKTPNFTVEKTATKITTVEK